MADSPNRCTTFQISTGVISTPNSALLWNYNKVIVGKGTGHDEPMLMTLANGKGCIFHTTLGHDPAAMSCVGFIVTLQRGAEWAATGKVTQTVPSDFPTAGKVSTRQ